MRREFCVRSEGDLVIDLRFGEQNGEFVDVLFPFFGGLAEGHDGLLPALRFEANFLLAPFGSEL